MDGWPGCGTPEDEPPAIEHPRPATEPEARLPGRQFRRKSTGSEPDASAYDRIRAGRGQADNPVQRTKSRGMGGAAVLKSSSNRRCRCLDVQKRTTPKCANPASSAPTICGN